MVNKDGETHKRRAKDGASDQSGECDEDAREGVPAAGGWGDYGNWKHGIAGVWC